MSEMSATRRQARAPQPVGKISWHGVILAVQPRIRLTRSFDQRSHSYLGYVLHLKGTVAGEAGEAGEFVVAIGEGVFVTDPRTETADLYKVSKLQVLKHSQGQAHESPPWHGISPELPVYRERGHRRLAARTYATKCSTCIWGCKMSVAMIIDQWNPSQKRYREETFCYGPLS